MKGMAIVEVDKGSVDSEQGVQSIVVLFDIHNFSRSDLYTLGGINDSIYIRRTIIS